MNSVIAVAKTLPKTSATAANEDAACRTRGSGALAQMGDCTDPFADNFELTGVGKSRLMQLSAQQLSAVLKIRKIQHNSLAQVNQLVSKLEAWKRERASTRRGGPNVNTTSTPVNRKDNCGPTISNVDAIVHPPPNSRKRDRNTSQKGDSKECPSITPAAKGPVDVVDGRAGVALPGTTYRNVEPKSVPSGISSKGGRQPHGSAGRTKVTSDSGGSGDHGINTFCTNDRRNEDRRSEGYQDQTNSSASARDDSCNHRHRSRSRSGRSHSRSRSGRSRNRRSHSRSSSHNSRSASRSASPSPGRRAPQGKSHSRHRGSQHQEHIGRYNLSHSHSRLLGNLHEAPDQCKRNRFSCMSPSLHTLEKQNLPSGK